MTLPLTTTTVTIERIPDDVDPYETATLTVVGLNVPAVVSGSSGAGLDVGGAQETLSAKLFTEQDVDLKKSDQVTDDTSGEVWRVLWVRERYELGLGHKVAGLEAVEGRVG